MSSPDSSRQDTFRLGSRTKAIMATHRPMANAAGRQENADPCLSSEGRRLTARLLKKHSLLYSDSCLQHGLETLSVNLCQHSWLHFACLRCLCAGDRSPEGTQWFQCRNLSDSWFQHPAFTYCFSLLAVIRTNEESLDHTEHV